MYKREEELYLGPICDVYKSHDAENNPVALKVADLDFVRPPHDFRREIELLKKLCHNNVAQYITHFSRGDDWTLVLEYYSETLEDKVRRLGRVKSLFSDQGTTHEFVNMMDDETASAIVWGLVDGLRYVHLQHIIHRDLKPTNVMFKGDNVPKIIDFGISYDINAPPRDEPPDMKHVDVSTGCYKAPELCLGVRDYGFEIDYWLLGIVIGYMYSRNGRPPIGSGNVQLDMQLIVDIFRSFGTPSANDDKSALYWPRLCDSHLAKFDFGTHPPMPANALLPRCNNEAVIGLFRNLTCYRNRSLLMPADDRLSG